MRNYLKIGPVGIRITRRNIASWGYPTIRIGGLEFFSMTNTGDLILASYSPRKSLTWYWSITLTKGRGSLIAKRRTGQWHDYYRLPFGRALRISQQDYHKRPVAA